MSTADPSPLRQELERQVRDRLGPVCAHLTSAEFDALVQDVVGVKTRFLHLDSDIGPLPLPDGQPLRSLAQRLGNIPHMRQRSAVPPPKPRA